MPGALNLIQGGRWDEALRRLFSMKQGAIAPVVAAELQPTIVLENDRGEHFALSNTRLATGCYQQNAVAGQYSMVQVMNPVDSGVLCVVTRMFAGSSSNTRMIARIGNVALTTHSQREVKADTRLINWAVGATFRPTCQVRNEANAALVAGTPIAEGKTLALTTIELIRAPIILKPGIGLYTTTEAQNQSNQTHFEWYERAINPSEEFER